MKRQNRNNTQGSRLPTKASLLQKAYAANGNGPVAYVDESYFDHSLHVSSGKSSSPFYVVGSVVVKDSDRLILNKELDSIVPSGDWHTTRDTSSHQGQFQLRQMLKKVTAGLTPIVVSRNVGADLLSYDKEAAREACLVALASYLVAQHDVGLIVLEQRRENEQLIDAQTISEAKRRGDIPRNLVAHQTSPRYENLLWLPDIVSSSMFRRMTGSNDKHYRPLHKKIIAIDC